MQEKGNAAGGLLMNWKLIFPKPVAGTAHAPIWLLQGHTPLVLGSTVDWPFLCMQGKGMLHVACEDMRHRCAANIKSSTTTFRSIGNELWFNFELMNTVSTAWYAARKPAAQDSRWESVLCWRNVQRACSNSCAVARPWPSPGASIIARGNWQEQYVKDKWPVKG